MNAWEGMNEISIRLPHFYYNCQNEKKYGKKNTVENISELEVPLLLSDSANQIPLKWIFFFSLMLTHEEESIHAPQLLMRIGYFF